MKAILISTLLTPLLFVTLCTPQIVSAQRPTNETSDRDFVLEAARGSKLEIVVGSIASERATNPKVKRFGEMMVREHSSAYEDLANSAAGYQLPTALTEEEQRHLKELRALRGLAFDRRYMELMVNTHRRSIESFARQAEHGSDPELRAFASETLPTLEDHLKVAEATRSIVTERQAG